MLGTKTGALGAVRPQSGKLWCRVGSRDRVATITTGARPWRPRRLVHLARGERSTSAKVVGGRGVVAPVVVAAAAAAKEAKAERGGENGTGTFDDSLRSLPGIGKATQAALELHNVGSVTVLKQARLANAGAGSVMCTSEEIAVGRNRSTRRSQLEECTSFTSAVGGRSQRGPCCRQREALQWVATATRIEGVGRDHHLTPSRASIHEALNCRIEGRGAPSSSLPITVPPKSSA